MTCKLCLQPRELRQSHIIPEFLFAPGYDEKHRLLEIRADSPSHRRPQKGWRERLLCSTCEGFINDNFERPISRIWSQLIPESIPASHDRLGLVNVPYAPFKLFHLSILWRASVATGRAWEPVRLGQRHEERLRAMLLAQDPGPPLSYPFLGNVMTGPASRDVALGTAMAPTSGRFGGARVYMFIYGGCSWHFIVSAHAAFPENPFIPSQTGTMVLGVRDLTTNKAFDKHMRAHVVSRAQAKKRRGAT